MQGEPELYIPGLCGQLVEIEKATRQELSEQAEHFMKLVGDCLKINFAIMGHYSHAQLLDLVYHASWGMLRELKWMHFLFLSGNYPLIKGRLRYVWENTFRAYFVEQHAD